MTSIALLFFWTCIYVLSIESEFKLRMRCLKEGCLFNTDDQIPATSSQADKLAVLRMHVDTTHLTGGQEQTLATVGSQVHAERMQKPKLVTSNGMVAEEDWEFFVHSWKQYKALAKVGPDTAPAHLSMVLGEVSGRVFNRVGGFRGLDGGAVA